MKISTGYPHFGESPEVGKHPSAFGGVHTTIGNCLKNRQFVAFWNTLSEKYVNKLIKLQNMTKA
jgi:hypothetical protein